MKINALKFLIHIIPFTLILGSCEKPVRILNRTLEQKEALNNDTLLLDFSLFMDTVHYQVKYLKAIVGKKIVKMYDGDYKYELDLGKKRYYGLIEPKFFNDSLVSLKVTFNDDISTELREILSKKYGEPSFFDKSSVYWLTENIRKTIILNTSHEYSIQYLNQEKYIEKVGSEIEKAKKIKDSALQKTEKDL